MPSCVEGGINTDLYNKLEHEKGSLVVSVPACGMSNQGLSLIKFIIFSTVGTVLCGVGDQVSRDISIHRCFVVWRGGGLSISRHFEIYTVGAVLCRKGMNPDRCLNSQAEQPSG